MSRLIYSLFCWKASLRAPGYPGLWECSGSEKGAVPETPGGRGAEGLGRQMGGLGGEVPGNSNHSFK